MRSAVEWFDLKKNILLFVLIAIGLASALISSMHRFQAEAHNRRVELVIDWPDAQALANTTSLPIRSVLAQLRTAYKGRGITSVALMEDTLESLRSNGIVSYHRNTKGTVLTFLPEFPKQQQRVEDSFRYKTRLTVTKTGPHTLFVKESEAKRS